MNIAIRAPGLTRCSDRSLVVGLTIHIVLLKRTHWPPTKRAKGCMTTDDMEEAARSDRYPDQIGPDRATILLIDHVGFWGSNPDHVWPGVDHESSYV